MAKKWFSEIETRLNDVEFNDWKSTHNINESDLASSYGSIYRKRFENDKTSGYEFLVQIMKDAKPSLGHIILAQILNYSPGHCVLTTNFDSLIESSIYQFTNKTPLVCGHESLSGYARPSLIHPLIVKIHRDLLLSPKSDPDEINNLDPGWKQPLDHIFSTHIPIVIGYGGNDGSLMSYFETMNKPSNFFWSGLNSNNVSNRIKKIIEKHEGIFVHIEGFDELMHALLWVFDEIQPLKDELKKITTERIQTVENQFDEIDSRKNNEEAITINTSNILNKNKELSALEYSNLADKELDLEKRKEIYLEALNKYPSTGWLWWRFTYFLQQVKKDFTDLDLYFQKALEVNEGASGLYQNYAIFLHGIKKDYNKAEEYYIKAITTDPSISNNYVAYGIFLRDVKNDYIKTEEYFLKALTLNPNDASANINYALFLKNIKKDYQGAEECFLKAIAADPDNANQNGIYANFLKNVTKDYDKAEEYYLKSLYSDPDSDNILNNYANFLKNIKNDYHKAEEYYLKALALNSQNANVNGNYAQILLERGDTQKAQHYIEQAYNSNGLLENDLLIELWFYRYAHFPEYLLEAENKIEELLSKGIRSLGWNFSGNISQAKQNQHINPDKLRDFASRITTE